MSTHLHNYDDERRYPVGARRGVPLHYNAKIAYVRFFVCTHKAHSQPAATQNDSVSLFEKYGQV